MLWYAAPVTRGGRSAWDIALKYTVKGVEQSKQCVFLWSRIALLYVFPPCTMFFYFSLQRCNCFTPSVFWMLWPLIASPCGRFMQGFLSQPAMLFVIPPLLLLGCVVRGVVRLVVRPAGCSVPACRLRTTKFFCEGKR